MKAVIAIIGEGRLAALVIDELSEHCKIVHQADLNRGVPRAAELVLVIRDDRHTFDDHQSEEILQQAGIPCLYGSVSLDEGVVGPFVYPGRPGCSVCAQTRRYMAGSGESNAMTNLFNRPPLSGEIPRKTRSSPAGLLHTARLFVLETMRILQRSQAYTKEHMYIINLETLKSSRHFFLPDPLCPVCGRLPDDSSAAARISLQPRPKIRDGSYRCHPIEVLKDVLDKDYLDSRTGLLNAKMHDLISPFASVTVNLPTFTTRDEVAGGRSHSYAKSEWTAILEGLERRCGLAPHGKQTVICDSFNRLADQAVDPAKVGLYTREQYHRPDFPFEPFDPDSSMNWVWGYSFLHERPILVPESLAYYSPIYGGSFVQEGSNGCALGGSIEEAIFYGMLEVVERDSFLMTWYARLAVPRLDPYSANDQELQMMIQRIQAVAGYDIHLFNITMENGIPSIWALAKTGDPEKMNIICAASAHIDPIRAAKSAVHELAGLMCILQKTFNARREECLNMFLDSYRVQQMEDHVMLYSLPQAEERLHFLLDTHRPLRTFDEEFKRKDSPPDLTDDLKGLIHVFRRLNLDVIVVDQSSPETVRNGLYCVKVLIPGMLPMTFGHHLTRLSGLERVLRVPMELGYAKQPLTPEQLNPYPHPFV